MGIYVFNRDVLDDALAGNRADFGKHIIPSAIETHRVHAFLFDGYWEDIGTIRAFFEANLDLCEPLPQFNFFDATAPIFTRPRFLPASKIIGARSTAPSSPTAASSTTPTSSTRVIGVRSRSAGADHPQLLIMGADYYDSPRRGMPAPAPPIHRHRAWRWIERTIVDKNARIGDDVRISPDGKPTLVDGPNYYIRDGIVIIPKNAVIMSGTVIWRPAVPGLRPLARFA